MYLPRLAKGPFSIEKILEHSLTPAQIDFLLPMHMVLSHIDIPRFPLTLSTWYNKLIYSLFTQEC